MLVSVNNFATLLCVSLIDDCVSMVRFSYSPRRSLST